MEFVGKIKSIGKDVATNKLNITFETDNNILLECEKLKDKDKLRIKAVQYRKKRSLTANAYFWVMLGKMADVLRTDKWDVYKDMIKTYGQYTYLVVKPDAVEGIKRQFRESEVVGDYEVNGQKGVQMLCYFGSSLYNAKEMAILIDGVVSECKALEIEVLHSDEIERMKQEWGVEEVSYRKNE